MKYGLPWGIIFAEDWCKWHATAFLSINDLGMDSIAVLWVFYCLFMCCIILFNNVSICASSLCRKEFHVLKNTFKNMFI